MRSCVYTNTDRIREPFMYPKSNNIYLKNKKTNNINKNIYICCVFIFYCFFSILSETCFRAFGKEIRMAVSGKSIRALLKNEQQTNKQTNPPSPPDITVSALITCNIYSNTSETTGGP